MDDAALIDSLPQDPTELKRTILQLSQREKERTRERDDWQVKFQKVQAEKQEIEIARLRLEVELLRLKKWYYGRKADQLTTSEDVAQMLLGFATDLEARPVNPGDLPDAADARAGADATADPAPVHPASVRRVRRGRRNLADFDNLPLTRHVHDLLEADKPCPCCGEARESIGQESSWQIEYIPGRFERIEHVRIKYACRRCGQGCLQCDQSSNIQLAQKPTQAIDRGLAGPGLLAYVVTAKYADYLPLYRLEAIFARNGFEIDRATQSVWCGDVAELLRPLYQRMVQRVLASAVICTDDTIMPMLARDKTAKARMWVYVGDAANPYNVFDFTPNRSRDGPLRFLNDYKQTLLADAYGGYDGVVVGNDITRAGCWAHARRKFVDAQQTHPVVAQEAVERIGRLYAIETQAKDQPPQQRQQLRQSQSQPILAQLQQRLWAWRDQLLPKHPMREAVAYTLNQWKELTVFAADGAVPIDNNVSEREMKRIVLNRKNSLFVGNARGGETAAILSSLTSTCRRHGINPQHYLTQLLTNLPDTPISQLDQWLADTWKQNQSALPEAP